MTTSTIPRAYRTRLLAAAAVLTVTSAGLLALRTDGSASAQTDVTTKVEPRSVRVQGIGLVTQVPDQVTISLGVETKAATAAAALRDNNAKSNELIKVLKARGVADKDLQTSQLSIYPQFDNRGVRITSYQVNNSVTATLKDLANAGALVDAAAAVAGDAIRVNSLSFSIADTSAVLAKARLAAVKDARAQAEQYAAAAGVKLGALRTITGGSASVPPPVFAEAKTAAASVDAAPAPILPGNQEVTANVELVFDLA